MFDGGGDGLLITPVEGPWIISDIAMRRLVHLTFMSSSLRSSRSLPTGSQWRILLVYAFSSSLRQGVKHRDLRRSSCPNRPSGGHEAVGDVCIARTRPYRPVR